ncbi:water stress/hypersensitive response domain-containing protein [Herbaspirillum sp. HC18]|nr:water stress/hypersensitive response domain-containing protein [Herbaspirillum sp. HC18]
MRLSSLSNLMTIAVLTLSACASLPGHEPVQVTVAGIESIPGEGLEVRMMVKLRVQNPNDTPIEYDGVYVKMDVQDKTLASGVSDERGRIPRFGESVIEVPVTLSTLRAGFFALGFMLDGTAPEKVRYKLNGKLDGPAFGSVRFQSDGELALPKP